ncbi:MAG TPA: APC family permease [Candidatus Limnocylindrales bacterium]|nr:APC family permease [Candidatus Limnocylindrales bacterium]
MSTISLPAQIPSPAIPSARRKVAKLTLWPLVAATFFMVSGGTYGTEAIISGAGYGRGILVLLFLPVLWCLPTAFMIGELSSALPAEGGYYAWVRRGLGDFWGFQEAWLSLAASIFDMAIYPTLFMIYLKQMVPWFSEGQYQLFGGLITLNHGMLAMLFVVVTCVVLNLAGIRIVGLTSIWLFFLLSLPFALVVLLSPAKTGAFTEAHAASTGATVTLLGAVLVAMWNYMGWDNASTIAQEVERPRKTYPRAMIAAVILVSLTYILPFLAVYVTGIPASAFNEEGSWATIAGTIGGTIGGFPWLRFMVTLGGMMSAFGMFNALVLSYSRLPLAMARDGMLPSVFARVTKQNKTPWVSIIICTICWLPCLVLGFQRLITLDIMLYGAALMLEFVTLVALRVREPRLRRGFRVPGGMAGAVTCGLFPFALLILATVESERESILGMNALLFGFLIIVAGFLMYFATSRVRARFVAKLAVEPAETA